MHLRLKAAMRILIVKLGAIGDVVHTLPALAAMRRSFPDAEIAWAVEKRAAEILRGNEHIDRLIEVDTRSPRKGKIEDLLPEVRSQLRELRGSKYDIAIDFQGLLKSGTIAKLSGAPERWGFDRRSLREPASRVFYTNTAKIEPRINVIRKNLTLAEAALRIDTTGDRLEFPIYTSDEHRKEAAAFAAQAGGQFALLNPAGGWVTKLWPAERYGELADVLLRELGLPSVVVTGPGEESLAERVRKTGSSGKTIFATPSLKGLYELAKLSSVYVGGDTGPTHLAVAAGAPVVGLYGPTEWWRNGSPNPDDVCVERLDIDCRVDCHRRSCSNWICM
ncbi:MAG TPA: lipopolysaccharide heptosyltransferase I, partial [Pyrinomonadaceae bacterium]|nr:lipopolysaccharide heptosyltransferase I [Pyrinomonadaceae bacterium]